MDSYITGTLIKTLRKSKGITQAELAGRLGVSDKAVSKWENGQSYPDITLAEPLAGALGVSVAELFAGKNVTNTNTGFNINRCVFYVCPVCGNVLVGTGQAVVSCHGVTLPPQVAEVADEKHIISIEPVEDELYVTVNHDMTKQHYISFIAAVTYDGVQFIKLYPEGNAAARIKCGRLCTVYAYCNRHGLFKVAYKH